MVLPPRLPGTRPRASARTACVPYTATVWRDHRVQDREHYPVLRSGSPVFAGCADSAAQGAALLRWTLNRRLARADPATALASTALGEGLAELLDPVDQLEHHAGGHRVVGAADGLDDEHVRARQRDRCVRVD